MPREITKTVYLFSELLEAVKNKEGPIKQPAVDRARSWLSELATSDDWYSVEVDWWKEALAKIGFVDAEISFSGFWSQGHGASFTSSIDLPKLINFLATGLPVPEEAQRDHHVGILIAMIGGKITNPEYLRLLEDDVINRLEADVIRTGSHYTHEHTCHIELNFKDEGEWISSTPEKTGHWVTKESKLVSLVNSFYQDVEILRLSICHAIYKALEKEYEYQTSNECLAEMSDTNEYTFDVYGNRDG